MNATPERDALNDRVAKLTESRHLHEAARLRAEQERDALRAELSALTAKLDATRAACEAVLAFSRTYDNLLGHIPNADQTRLVRQLRAALA